MFSGAITAIVTPFIDGELDEARLTQQVEYQIAQGIDGLVPVGTTGESPTLNIDEHHRVIERVIEIANGRVPVIAGVGANATEEALALHQFAHSVGATAGLSVNPYYNKPTQEGMYQHFMRLSDKCALPIVLYNIPGRTGVTMSPATVARLHDAGNFVAIKEATGVLDIASEIRSLCDITILSGDDSLTIPLMSIGAAGVISVLSNVLPAAVKQATQLALANDFAAAAKVHHGLFNLTKSIFLDGNPAGVKWAMKLLGRDSGELRLPVVEPSEATKKLIAKCLAELPEGVRSESEAMLRA